jgi:hypothetical protein
MVELSPKRFLESVAGRQAIRAHSLVRASLAAGMTLPHLAFQEGANVTKSPAPKWHTVDKIEIRSEASRPGQTPFHPAICR